MLSGDIKKVGNSTTKSGRIVSTFSVPCQTCKKDRIVKRKQHAINHADKPCKTCSNKNNNPQGEYRGIRISWWNKYKHGAAYRNILWDLSIDDAVDILNKQQWKCALSGLDIVCSGDLNTITASLDRISNLGGYTKDNIQFVHKEVNMMRGSLSLKRFIELSSLISDKVKW